MIAETSAEVTVAATARARRPPTTNATSRSVGRRTCRTALLAEREEADGGDDEPDEGRRAEDRVEAGLALDRFERLHAQRQGYDGLEDDRQQERPGDDGHRAE